jgi:RecA/RadA recombinase
VKDYIAILKEDNPSAKFLVVWDSVGASVSRSETERNLADERHGQPGQDAKENGSVVRHWVGTFNRFPDSICVLLVNQTYAKIGFMQHGDQAKGGSGIEYFSSLIVGLRRVKILTKTEKKKKVKYGIITRATVSKNHLSQGKTSVYQMDFVITAAGSQISDEEISDDEEGDET